MAFLDIDKAIASDLTNATPDYSVLTQELDSAGDQRETTWINPNWAKYLGYYKEIPELAAAIDAKATWTVGKGFTADPEVTQILDEIRGWGKDTFNTILENMIRTYHVAGDAFAEIIRDEKGNLINLKPLDPGKIRLVVNRQGILIRYEQVAKVKQPEKKFAVEDIFHLARNRIGDEIHGVSMITNLERIILMRNEAMEDLQEVYHRFVKPKFIFHLDTDDPGKIARFKAKHDAITGKGENMYIPKDVVVPEQISIAPNSTLNPQPWIDSLNQYFFQATGGTDIVIGASLAITESAGKIKYLAFQQTIEEEQLFIEESVGQQLGLLIKLEFPASLENELLSDEKKDGEGEQAAQPTDTTATIEGET